MENRCLDNRTLEGALRTLILYTGHFGGGNVSTYRWDTWNPGVGEALLQSKVIRPLANADGVKCEECGKGCWLEPTWETLPGGRRILEVYCDMNENVSHIEIEPERMRQWGVDLKTLATFFADKLELKGQLNESVSGLLVDAGRRRFAGQLRHFYVGRGFWGPEGEAFARVAADWMFGPGAVLLIPAAPEPGRPRPKTCVTMVPMVDVVFEDDGKVEVDIESIVGVVPTPPRQDTVAPIDPSPDTTWKQVFITFLDERTVQIKAPGVNERRNFETMGMADTRKKPPEPNQVWTLLQDMALAGGEMTWKEQGASASVRTTVKRLRNQLREVFGIEDDPITEYRLDRRWKARFALRWVNEDCGRVA